MAPSRNDKFSRIPIEVVIKIISYLPFLESFRLCLLKKEWHTLRLWHHCNSLELDETKFIAGEATRRHINLSRQSPLTPDIQTSGRRCFSQFMNTILPQISSRVLSKFSFQMLYSVEYNVDISNWIRFALSKRVKELHLDFSDGHHAFNPQRRQQYVLPEFFYQNGRRIRVLSLTSCSLSDYCNFMTFASLRVITFSKLAIVSMQIDQLLTFCPRLESLSLIQCYQILKIEITRSNLDRMRTLVLRNCEPLSLGIELSLPWLEYFEYAGPLVRFDVRNLGFLEKVVLDFQMSVPFPYLAQEIRDFLSGFCNARIFTLCTSALKVFPTEYLYGQPMLKSIQNVQHLILKSAMERYEIPAILSLLRISPFLRTLSISLGSTSSLINEFAFMDEEYPELPNKIWNSNGWSLFYLEKLKLDGFRGKWYEIKLLKFILKNSRRLHKIKITPRLRGNPDLYLDAYYELKRVKKDFTSIVVKWR